MNFLFDRSQPLHLTAGTICDVFQASKRTVGAKATEIESQLRLHRFSESGLCRSEFVEMFTEVRLPNGIVLPWKMAQQWGCLPPDARPEDFL